MCITFRLWAVLGLLMAAAACGLCANLVTNGSFEQSTRPPPPKTESRLARGSTDITGWTVTGDGVDLVGPRWQPADGECSVDLNREAPGGLRSAPMPTVAGKEYDLVFATAANPDAGPPERLLRLLINGAEVETFTFDARSVSEQAMGWVDQRHHFTANSPQTVLEFESLTPGPRGPMLDNVRLSAGNHPPTAPAARGVRPARPVEGQDLQANAGSSTDADVDEITYEFLWEFSLDGGKSWFFGPTGEMLPGTNTKAGQTWRFRVRARDWLDASGWVTSPEATIQPAPH